jgi:hypothetical protein
MTDNYYKLWDVVRQSYEKCASRSFVILLRYVTLR